MMCLLVTHARSHGLQLLTLQNAPLGLENLCRSAGKAQHRSCAVVRGGRSGLSESLPDRFEICVTVFCITPCKSPQDACTTNKHSIKKKQNSYLLCMFEKTVAEGSPESVALV